MSDKLLPDENGKEYEYDEEENSSLISKILDKISEISPGTGEDDRDGKDEETGSTGLGLGNSDEEDEEKTWKDKLDRFTVIVIGVEIFLVIYFIVALLGFAPFF